MGEDELKATRATSDGDPAFGRGQPFSILMGTCSQELLPWGCTSCLHRAGQTLSVRNSSKPQQKPSKEIEERVNTGDRSLLQWGEPC